MGDLKSFVTRDYPKYLSYVDDLKFPVKKWSDSRARDMSELLNRLIGKIIFNICQKMGTVNPNLKTPCAKLFGKTNIGQARY